MAKTKKNNNQNMRNIFIALLIIIGIIFLIIYFAKWHEVKYEEKYQTSYLVSTNTIYLEINDLSEIETVLADTPANYFVYISYTKDEDIYNYEKKLKPIIDNYSLQNSFYYLNITDIKEENNYQTKIANKLNIKQEEVKEIPVILYFENGSLEETLHTANELKELVKSLEY